MNGLTFSWVFQNNSLTIFTVRHFRQVTIHPITH